MGTKSQILPSGSELGTVDIFKNYERTRHNPVFIDLQEEKFWSVPFAEPVSLPAHSGQHRASSPLGTLPCFVRTAGVFVPAVTLGVHHELSE